MTVIFIGFFLGAIGGIGDKTQLLALSLTARTRKRWIIVAGVAIGTILNHILVSWFGNWIADYLPDHAVAFIAALLFIAFGLWALQDGKENSDSPPAEKKFSAKT